ncbi:hypothetical protein KsCSTR_12300 [Candidatus Kuenenia stuttgartiensis]|uniref:Uncharacterized protein n=1 Tax=Kuenenia stuttgartiensis TaxID=174633 RepID=Q1PY74_KUEST|nr:hypothetical protein KsCSTR_12300 [Candidatus Kuenenia stuttgartiensis]CAJ72042.1 unknown protein [Candidatus Kuenenia stuttgartiensis]
MTQASCLLYFTLKLDACGTILPLPPANGIFTKNRECSCSNYVPRWRGCRGWTGFLHRFNYPFIMKTNSPLFPTLRRQFHPLNPPPAGDKLAISLQLSCPCGVDTGAFLVFCDFCHVLMKRKVVLTPGSLVLP